METQKTPSRLSSRNREAVAGTQLYVLGTRDYKDCSMSQRLHFNTMTPHKRRE